MRTNCVANRAVRLYLAHLTNFTCRRGMRLGDGRAGVTHEAADLCLARTQIGGMQADLEGVAIALGCAAAIFGPYSSPDFL